MMTLVNEFYDQGRITAGDFKALLLLLSPVAPHICEEIWQNQGYGGYIHSKPWPGFDAAFLTADEVEIAVQVNGKVRLRLMVPSGLDQETGRAELTLRPEVADLIAGREILKCVYVPDRLLNLVLR